MSYWYKTKDTFPFEKHSFSWFIHRCWVIWSRGQLWCSIIHSSKKSSFSVLSHITLEHIIAILSLLLLLLLLRLLLLLHGILLWTEGKFGNVLFKGLIINWSSIIIIIIIIISSKRCSTKLSLTRSKTWLWYAYSKRLCIAVAKQSLTCFRLCIQSLSRLTECL